MTTEQLTQEAIALSQKMDNPFLTEDEEQAIVTRLSEIEAIIGTDYIDKF